MRFRDLTHIFRVRKCISVKKHIDTLSFKWNYISIGHTEQIKLKNMRIWISFCSSSSSISFEKLTLELQCRGN